MPFTRKKAAFDNKKIWANRRASAPTAPFESATAFSFLQSARSLHVNFPVGHATFFWCTLYAKRTHFVVSWIAQPQLFCDSRLSKFYPPQTLLTHSLPSPHLRFLICIHSPPSRHVEPPLVIVRFWLLRRVPGISFQLPSRKSSHCLRCAGNLRQQSLPSLFQQTDRDMI